MVIGLDFDGVITNCGKLKSLAAKKLYGIHIDPDDFKKEVLVGCGHMTIAQYRHLQNVVYCQPEFGLLMEEVDGSLGFIIRLMDDGHAIKVITSRSETALVIATDWCRLVGLELDLTGVGYGNSKAEACASFGVQMFVDDDLDKLEELQSVVPRLFLFSWGYNRHSELSPEIKRISAWHELYNVVREIGG